MNKILFVWQRPTPLLIVLKSIALQLLQPHNKCRDPMLLRLTLPMTNHWKGVCCIMDWRRAEQSVCVSSCTSMYLANEHGREWLITRWWEKRVGVVVICLQRNNSHVKYVQFGPCNVLWGARETPIVGWSHRKVLTMLMVVRSLLPLSSIANKQHNTSIYYLVGVLNEPTHYTLQKGSPLSQ